MKEANNEKSRLPLLIFPASEIDVTPALKDSQDGKRKKGDLGKWRVQNAVHLNGLYLVDYDHLSETTGKTPEEVFASWLQDFQDLTNTTPPYGHPSFGKEGSRMWAENLGIVLVHKTSSDDGIRIVAKADAQRGNLADNMAWLDARLGMKTDESVKDASRGSFCPCFNDILYINNEQLFNYEDKEFDLCYGENYRSGNSHASAGNRVQRSGNRVLPAATGSGAGGVYVGEDGEVVGLDETILARIKDGYHDCSYQAIVDEWFRQRGGRPKAGDRHRSLLQLAAALRYICDNDAAVVAGIIALDDVGKAIIRERGFQELADIASSVCAKQLYYRTPPKLQAVLEALHIQLADEADNGNAAEAHTIDYESYWKRLRPLLSDSPGLREACATLSDTHKMGGILVAGAMLGSYLSRCWWEHYDGKYYRLSFLTYIIGAAASGKSFVVDMDELLMAPMQSLDKVGRKLEDDYNARVKSRKANEALPEQPKAMVRYCPSSTSNNVLYRRLKNALDKDVIDPTTGEPIQLHLVTVESELATALRSQVGNWAGKQDFELKSFHNEKAGVDYANSQSTNGIMQVNWNQIISGTQESFSRKVKPSNVLDGLVTRLAVFPMPENDFQMIEKKRCIRNSDREAYLRTLGYDLERVHGELKVGKLVDFCYKYEEQLTQQAKLEHDETLDYFRKRIPVIMMRYAIVRMVLRQLKEAAEGKPLKIDKSDFAFAKLIGDFCLESQIFMFGKMVEDARAKEREAFMPRKLQTGVRDSFNKLPEQFTTQDAVEAGLGNNQNLTSKQVSRLIECGFVKRIKKGIYKKTTKRL